LTPSHCPESHFVPVRETLATHRPREEIGVLPVRYYLLTFDSRLSLTPLQRLS